MKNPRVNIEWLGTLTMKTDEPENFETIFEIEDGLLAIVPVSILKALKKVPLGIDPILIPTKTTSKSKFKLTATYDDAILRKLSVEPAEPDAVPTTDLVSKKIEQGESAITEFQLQGHDKNPIGRQVRKTRKSKRQSRNELYNKKRRAVSPKNKISGKLGKIGKHNGAQRSNYGQPEWKTKSRRGKRKMFRNNLERNFVTFLSEIASNNRPMIYESEIPLYYELLNDMRTISDSGWSTNGDQLIHESGLCLNSNDWNLNGDTVVHNSGATYNSDLIDSALDYLNKIGMSQPISDLKSEYDSYLDDLISRIDFNGNR